MDPRIKSRLAKVSKRLRSVRTGWSLAWLWLLATLCGGFIMIALRTQWPVFYNPFVGQTALRDWLAIGGLAATLTIALLLMAIIRFRRPNYPHLIQQIEQRFPDLEQRLLTASQIPNGSPDRPLGYLQRCVVSEAIRHDVQYDWPSLVSSSRIATAWSIQTLALLCLLATAWLLWTTPEELQSMPALANPVNLAAVTAPIVDPGNTEIERGSSLIVTARFDRQIPDEVWLVQAAATGRAREHQSRLRMRPSLEDPIFAAYLTSVNEPLDYRIEYGSHTTSVYRVEVFDVPALVRADADLVYPAYARQTDRSLLDTRRITVPAGTQVTWKLQLNKAVATAELVGADGVAIPLVPDEAAPTLVKSTLVLQESQDWLVRLIDAQGRSNAREIKLQAKVLPNEPAKIQLLAGGDARVSPLEEFDVSAKVSDDHALTSAGLAYQFGGGAVIEIVGKAFDVAEVARLSAATADESVGKSVGKNVNDAHGRDANHRQVTFTQRIDLEALEAQPNQLLSYYVWAEDVGSDGKSRRTVSDIYFAEVRPFEEIFREGQQPTSEQQQQQAADPQTEELVELQKQIVVATWNLMRAQPGAELPHAASADLDLLVESQKSAVQLLQEKAEDIQDAQLQLYVEQASQDMQSAIDRLTTTRQTLARAELQAALGHEQSAYEALLQLQSREHQVVRSQQPQSQSASRSSPARQAQLEQLALSNDENRYEDQRLAQSQEQEQQSEMRQVNSRLRELAARQQDLNQQLRELQAALQAAQSADEQAELERRLQRLREQQQQMLADSDELNERMQNPANESMQQAQTDMQQARDNMQRATEALRQDKPGEALAAGARAEQQMRELQDSLRKQSANQFQQSLQEMQQRAAGMEEKQSQLAQQLRGQPSSEPPPNNQLANTPPASGDSTAEKPTQETRQDAASQNIAPQGAASQNATAQNATVQKGGPQDNAAERTAACLRGDEPGQRQVADALREQQADLQDLLQQMEATVNEAEATEPLLAQRLYDSYRHMQQNKTLERLQVTERLVERNLQQPAGALAQTSAEELSELRQQIDRAADAVLGSDVESLRLALNKLETLADELNAEFPDRMWPDAPPSVPPTPTPSPSQPQPQSPSPSQTQTQTQTQTPSSPSPQSLRSPSSPSNQSSSSQSPPTQSSSASPPARPLTGDGFRDWSDTLRDVEELVGDAELRWQATEIRQAARELRGELKKHAAEPQWEAVQELVASPLRELKHKVADELMRRAADKTQIVPLDRDPVPNEFSRSVRQYFENLGSGQ